MRHRAPAHYISNFRANGFIVVKDFLSADEFRQLQSEVIHLREVAVEMVQPPATTRRLNLDATNCAPYPALGALLNNTQLLWLLRYAAGYGGTPIIAVQCIHTDADSLDQVHDPQTDWHVDTFHSTGKAWLFLHDVHENEGPFAYVPKSHKITKERADWEKKQSLTAANHPNRLHAKGSFRATPAELLSMGYEQPVLAAVSANTLVVGDTSGFHRRTPSSGPTVRVEIYLSLRRNPFFAGLYPSLLSLPGIRQRWAGLALRIYRWQQQHGIPSWRPSIEKGLTSAEISKLQ
jgi:hypothetical protein